MLAEENKNAGPSALDGKSAEISIVHTLVFHLDASVLLLFLIQFNFKLKWLNIQVISCVKG